MKVPILANRGSSNPMASEAYRAYARDAVKKGFFNPRDEDMVKLAAEEIQHIKANDFTPSGNINIDIARLTEGLRARGFDKQANDIEESFLSYKVASNELYNMKMDDVAEFAHRDGDQQLFEGEHGAVETIQNAAKKIRKIVEKEPKQVQAYYQERLQKLFKKGQEAGFGFSDNAEKIIDSVADVFADFKFQRTGSELPIEPNTLTLDAIGLSTEKGQLAYKIMANVDPSDVQKWYQLQKIAKANGVVNQNGYLNRKAIEFAILSDPHGGGYNKIKNVAEVLGIDISQYYQRNSRYSIFRDPNIVNLFVETPVDPKKIGDLINTVITAADQLYEKVWGINGNKYKHVHSVLSDWVKKLYERVNQIDAEVNSNTAEEALQELQGSIKNLLSLKKDFVRGSRILKTVSPEDFNALVSWMDNLYNILNSGFEKAANLKGLFKAEIYLKSLSVALKYWEKIAENSDQQVNREKASRVIKEINNIGRALYKANNKPFSAVQEALAAAGVSPENIPDTQEALKNDVEQLAQLRLRL